MKLSIIIPVYNAEKYLVNTVQSVINQNVSDYEIILINDGSIDQSLDICYDLSKNYNCIKVINQANGGPAKARNEGIKIAIGDYITFVDADDTISDYYYQTMLEVAKKYSPDIIISNINLIGNQQLVLNNPLIKDELLDKTGIKKNVLSNYYGGGLGNIPSLVNKFYKNSFLKKHLLLIDETRIRAEDYWFNFNAFKKAKSCYAIDRAFYNYNIQVEGSVMKSFRETQYNGFIKTRNELLLANKDLLLTINYSKWDTEFINNTNEFILLAIKNKRWDIVNSILKDNTYNDCFKNYEPCNLHTSLIKFFQLLSITIGSKIIYSLWSTKIN